MPVDGNCQVMFL